MKRLFALLLILFATAGYALAASGDDIVGVWYDQPKKAKIDIFKCGDVYCGKIVWLREPNYPEGSKDGQPGTPKLDHKNPDPAQKKVPVMGLQIAQGFHYAGGNQWKDGKIYDPDEGKTYSAKMKLVSPKQLNLRGYVGVSLFGRTDNWTKAE